MKPKPKTEHTLASIVLGFELIVVFLTGLTFFGLNVTDPQWLSLVITGVAMLGVIVAIIMMRRGKVGVLMGWILHVAFFIPAFILPTVLILAIIFGALWVFAIVKGKQIDRMREASSLS